MPVAQKGVRTTHPEYDRLSPLWKKCRDVIAGQEAMHAAREAYLPKLKDETEEDYCSRVKRSDFFNGTWITLRAFIGMLFRKVPAQDVPKAMEEHLKDVTMTGKHVEAFAKALSHEALAITRFGILVDHPAAMQDKDGKVVSITVAVAEKLGIRPKLALYTAETIINWRAQEAGKPGQYAMLVLREEHPIGEDEFSHECETRYRVLDLVNGKDNKGNPTTAYRQRLFRIGKDGKDEQVGGDNYPLMNGKPLEEIPFRTYGADGEETDLDEPALIDLVNGNVAVYQINADYRHGLHWTGLPTLFLAGLDQDPDKTYYIGSAKAITATHPDAKAAFIEFTGQGLTEIREAIREKKQEMAMAGARAIMDETKQVETLGGTQIKRNGENSALANVAITVSSAIEWALSFFSKWAGQEAEIVYQLNRDFMIAGLSAQDMAALLANVMAGKISDREYYEILQRHDVLDSEKPFEEHEAEVEITAPAPARPAPKAKPGEEIAA